jgi:hypothetical protein
VNTNSLFEITCAIGSRPLQLDSGTYSFHCSDQRVRCMWVGLRIHQCPGLLKLVYCTAVPALERSWSSCRRLSNGKGLFSAVPIASRLVHRLELKRGSNYHLVVEARAFGTIARPSSLTPHLPLIDASVGWCFTNFQDLMCRSCKSIFMKIAALCSWDGQFMFMKRLPDDDSSHKMIDHIAFSVD